jgi:hypothetical protein
VPRDDGVEAVVELRVGIDAVQADAARSSRRRERRNAGAGVEVVKSLPVIRKYVAATPRSASSSAIVSAASSDMSTSCRSSTSPDRGSLSKKAKR